MSHTTDLNARLFPDLPELWSVSRTNKDRKCRVWSSKTFQSVRTLNYAYALTFQPWSNTMQDYSHDSAEKKTRYVV